MCKHLRCVTVVELNCGRHTCEIFLLMLKKENIKRT